MAGSYNKVILMGNLTRDVEVRSVSADNSVANFGLAINRRFKTKAGEQREETTYVDCEAWGRAGETIAEYTSKGSSLHVEGRLKLDQWQDKDGANRSKLKVVVEGFSFISASHSGGETRGKSGAASGAKRPPKGNDPGAFDDDDIPF